MKNLYMTENDIENTTHSIRSIASILKQHGIKTEFRGAELWAYEEIYDTITKTDASQWLNVTNWETYQILNFLGY